MSGLDELGVAMPVSAAGRRQEAMLEGRDGLTGTRLKSAS